MKQAASLIAALEETPRYAALCLDGPRRLGRRRIRKEFLYPDPQLTKPRHLHIRKGEIGVDVSVRERQWPEVIELFSTIAGGISRQELRLFRKAAVTKEIIDLLNVAECFEPHSEPSSTKCDIVYVGHNTTLVRSQQASVLVDPYFRPASEVDLPNYQPMQPKDVGRIDAVVITHSHGDHFHLGSLLQLPRTTRFFVPPVERENLFSTDCALRLRQLGFQNVEALAWGERRLVRDVEMTALPFFGEQATCGETVEPRLRNIGSTWHIRTPKFAAAFFADSGFDATGDMRTVAKSLRGQVDYLFCGVRGFRLAPIFFGFTTLDAYLVNVPRNALTQSQQLMADAPSAFEYARLMGAQYLVPCADGGAPWYWREGMGPRYQGYPGTPYEGASHFDENPDADPFPENVVKMIHRRTGDPLPITMRPGEILTHSRTCRIESAPGPFRWPF